MESAATFDRADANWWSLSTILSSKKNFNWSHVHLVYWFSLKKQRAKYVRRATWPSAVANWLCQGTTFVRSWSPKPSNSYICCLLSPTGINPPATQMTSHQAPTQPTNIEVLASGAAPQCPNGHQMVISDYSENGYTSGYICGLCRGRSSQGLCGGTRRRWFCQQCHEDYCFDCRAESVTHIPCLISCFMVPFEWCNSGWSDSSLRGLTCFCPSPQPRAGHDSFFNQRSSCQPWTRLIRSSPSSQTPGLPSPHPSPLYPTPSRLQNPNHDHELHSKGLNISYFRHLRRIQPWPHWGRIGDWIQLGRLCSCVGPYQAAGHTQHTQIAVEMWAMCWQMWTCLLVNVNISEFGHLCMLWFTFACLGLKCATWNVNPCYQMWTNICMLPNVNHRLWNVNPLYYEMWPHASKC